MTVPFFPPDQFGADAEVLVDLVRQVGLDPEQRFILGRRTRELEDLLRAELGVADVVACGSGTSGLILILRGLGIGPGDNVVVPAFGCAPLAASVLAVGASPVFADVDPWTMVADPVAVESAITVHTRAIMPAHIFSVMADMPAFRALADRRGVRLIEDSAVGQGAVLAGRPAGTHGDAGVFSFVQVKSFGGPGEGGVVLTADADLGAVVRMLRNHGQDGVHRFTHHRIGYNSRFDELLAAFQLHRYPTLPDRLARRAEIAEYYTERFAPLAERGIVAPPAGRDGRCYYVYTLLADERDRLRDHLADNGISSHAYYPLALPDQPAFRPFAGVGQSWPNARSASARALSIPVYPQLRDADVTRIADTICAFTPTNREKPCPVA